MSNNSEKTWSNHLREELLGLNNHADDPARKTAIVEATVLIEIAESLKRLEETFNRIAGALEKQNEQTPSPPNP